MKDMHKDKETQMTAVQAAVALRRVYAEHFARVEREHLRRLAAVERRRKASQQHAA